MDIGIIGAGNVGRLLADGWAAAGHRVTLGSRTPGSVPGPHSAATVAELVGSHQVVVNATPGTASVDALTAAGAEAYQGKIVIDVANAITPDFGLAYPDGSLGERVQRALPGARVVKALNTAAMEIVTAPGSLSGPTSLFLSGDDADAKATVAGLVRDLGWAEDSVIDLGGIETARATEHYFLLFAALMRAAGRSFNIRVVTGG